MVIPWGRNMRCALKFHDRDYYNNPPYAKHIAIPDSKVHGANMGPIWDRQVLVGPHVGPMNLAIWDDFKRCYVPRCIWTYFVSSTVLKQVYQISIHTFTTDWNPSVYMLLYWYRDKHATGQMQERQPCGLWPNKRRELNKILQLYIR